MNARRTAVRLTFAGVDISTDINKHLLSLTYTDNEEDKTTCNYRLMTARACGWETG